ncbi:hypothetical protein [Methylosarcina fibrata]|uniref:hypothetical protein n=1 Tax=Methylosarcina fibrata TaxID=105972 RepID=UPI000371E61C|nr:hypothetical protein [Methylosarcina fibrata]
MADKTLFVHAGGSKTGSSALQNFFYFNVSRLEHLGFAYENRYPVEHEHEIANANGRLLYDLMSSSTFADDDVDNLLLSYFGRCDNAICSSEFLAELNAGGWKRLYESSLRIGVQLKVIFYVRNVIPFFQSAYDQIIKRHGAHQLFDDWVTKAFWQHGRSLLRIATEMPRSNLQVVHYDQARAHLIRGFLDILGVDPSFRIDPRDQSRQVNRSLTQEERKILIAVNKALGAAYSMELSDLLIYANPDARGEPASYSQATVDLLQERFNPEVHWVNTYFFEDQPVVSVLPYSSGKNEPIVRLNEEEKQKNTVEKQVLNWAIEKLKTFRDETESLIAHAIRVAARSEAKDHPDLPADFDVLSYLLINRDVLHAGVDPIQHYLNYGRNEKRAYNYHFEPIPTPEDCASDSAPDVKTGTISESGEFKP